MLEITRHNGRNESTTELTSMWKDIAMRQQTERDKVVRANALLYEMLRRQYVVTMKIAKTLQKAQAFPSLMIPQERVLRVYPWNATVPPLLHQRLDDVEQYACSVPSIALQTIHDKVFPLHWTSTSKAVQFQARITARYPFKLSVITTELWKMFHDNSSGECIGQVEEYETPRRFHFCLHKPFGQLQVEGVSISRRTFLPDGSVLLAVAALSTGPLTDGNAMAGFEMHELMWARITRHDNNTLRSMVGVEIVSEVEVRATENSVMITLASQLKQVQAYAQRCNDEDGGRTQRDLEYRMLRSSMASS